jgi:hypothetical protein
MVRNSTEGTPNICRKKSFYAFDLCKNADLFSPQKYVVFHDVTAPLEHEIFSGLERRKRLANIGFMN